MSTLTMSPSMITVESGMPWQMTSLRLVQQRLGEALVAERRGVRALVAEELVHHPVDLVRGDAGLAVLAGQLQRLGGDPARDAHLLDGLRGLDVRALHGFGAVLPTYSGRTMRAGTGRAGERVPGISDGRTVIRASL